MAKSRDTQTFELSAHNIDEYSEHLAEVLAGINVEQRDCVRIRLTLEEALLRVQDRFGAQAEVRLTVATGLVRGNVRLEYAGPAFNPLGDNAGADEPDNTVFTRVGLRPLYAYDGKRNVLRLPIPRRSSNPAASMLAFLLIGVVTGILGSVIVSSARQVVLYETVFTNFFDLWVRVLNALAAPVIFLMVAATLLDARRISERGGNRRHLTRRYFLLSFLVGGIVVVASVLAFRPSWAVDRWNMELVSSIMGGVIQVIPRHIVDPFITSNTPQLLLLAFVLANAVIALGDSARQLSNVISQANMVSSLVTEWVSALAPLFAGMFLAIEIGGDKIDMLVQLWKPLLMGLVVSLLTLAVQIGVLAARKATSPVEICKKLWPPFWLTLRKGTLGASYDEAAHSCVRGLGISKAFTDVALPQGLVLYMPSSVIGTLAYIVFSADSCGVEVSVMWCVTAVILDVLLFVATPPVPGANLLAFIAIFDALHIPQTMFVDAMIFDIVFGLFANALNQASLQLVMVDAAERMGFLDGAALRKPVRH